MAISTNEDHAVSISLDNEFLAKMLVKSGSAIEHEGKTYTMFDSIDVDQENDDTLRIRFRQNGQVISTQYATCHLAKGATLTIAGLQAALEVKD